MPTLATTRQPDSRSRRIAEETGNPPTDEELARAMGISVEEVYDLYESARAQHFVSMDETADEQPAEH